MEGVMVIAVVGLLMFMSKVTAKENNADQASREDEADGNEDDGAKMS